MSAFPNDGFPEVLSLDGFARAVDAARAQSSLILRAGGIPYTDASWTAGKSLAPTPLGTGLTFPWASKPLVLPGCLQGIYTTGAVNGQVDAP